MFERFTERAREVIVLAQEEAARLGHDFIGTEHLLLGLLREEDGLAARVLAGLDVTAEEVRPQVARIVGEARKPPSGMVPFTPRARQVLELALREALSLGHGYIGTEHILLGLVRENEGVAARILLDFGADARRVRSDVLVSLSDEVGGEPAYGVVQTLDAFDAGSWPGTPPSSAPLVVAIALAAAGFPLGLLVGYLIWS